MAETGERRGTYITPQGFDRLKAELDHLWRVERPVVTQEVHDAAALGDRSENGGYIYGKKRLREIDSRIRYLSKKLENLTVVSTKPVRQDRVSFGAWVTVEDEDGEVQTWRLVGPDEVDPKAGLISIESPIGRALMGKRVDDEVLVHRPKGDTHCTILSFTWDSPDGG